MGRLSAVLSRFLKHLGIDEYTYLTALAVLIGIFTAAAAVGLHKLIYYIRSALYDGVGTSMYTNWHLLPLLVLLPALGGLIVGLFARYVVGAAAGHGIIDVMESVLRSGGVVRPATAPETIFSSAVTIGSGGSAGAEGPIVQIGAGIAAGIGRLFRASRQHVPLLIGCGSAAGISAIFNAPIGGVFFTLEVILHDFSARTFTPIVLASVVANVTTKGILLALSHGREPYLALFAMPHWQIDAQTELAWRYLPNFFLLGLVCALVGAAFTRLSYFTEGVFSHGRVPKVLRPALGGAILGLCGAIYVLVVGWWLLGRSKPIAFANYPLPAFFGEGYPVVSTLISTGAGPGMWSLVSSAQLIAFLSLLCLLKLVGTCLTLSSGGSGGIIAPSLFLGATAGGIVGLLLRQAGLDVQPGLYALVGMGAVLAAVAHAPLASMLILLELTQDYKIILPVMLAAVVATAMARILTADSIYTLALRRRGVQIGAAADLTVLRRFHVDQADLQPPVRVKSTDPLNRVLDLMDRTGAAAFIVEDEGSNYRGIITAAELREALLQPDAIPLLLVRDVMRAGIPTLQATDDLASALVVFSQYDIDYLPVVSAADRKTVSAMLSRAALIRCYQGRLWQS